MLDRLTAWHEWLLPEFYREGKSLFRIGIACTGGQHRSVTLVEKLYEVLKEKKLANIYAGRKLSLIIKKKIIRLIQWSTLSIQ